MTILYALDGPGTGSGDAIVHTVALRPSGGVAPGTIDTGSAGLAQDLPLRLFGTG